MRDLCDIRLRENLRHEHLQGIYQRGSGQQ